eukprot:TCALIF_07563-PB protein Name:"Protein of unknown function" AED:0.42 eAED:0.42 QI:0/0.5/0.66/0.66/0/0/3/357/159
MPTPRTESMAFQRIGQAGAVLTLGPISAINEVRQNQDQGRGFHLVASQLYPLIPREFVIRTLGIFFQFRPTSLPSVGSYLGRGRWNQLGLCGPLLGSSRFLSFGICGGSFLKGTIVEKVWASMVIKGLVFLGGSKPQRPMSVPIYVPRDIKVPCTSSPI